jgi:predicted RNA-binding Zn ribbon-like protein
MDDSQKSPLRIDNNLLVELGLAALPTEEKSGFLKHIYETLEMRVGMRLADQMTNEQLDEFETFYNAKDDAGAFKWLETNFPNYKDIVADEFQKLKTEIAQSAPQILAASQQQQAEAAPAAPQPQPNEVYPPQQPQSPQEPPQYS